MSDREKDVEILVLRHQLRVPQRRVGKPTGRFPLIVDTLIIGS
ncbi:hypothetical protein [Streptomyces endocoffeicus]